MSVFDMQHFHKQMRPNFFALLFCLTSAICLAAELPTSDPIQSVLDVSADDFQGKFEILTRVDRDLQELVRFVQAEQDRLRRARKLLEELKNQEQHLQVLAKTDQRVVDELFREQESRASVAVWHERWIGFGLGVLASMVAGFISARLVYLYKSRPSIRTPDVNKS